MRVRAKCLLFWFGVCLSFTVSAQYSNSWIKPTQQYFKIPICKEGIYRLSASDLTAAGFPVNAVDPRFIQLFHRGIEQSIYVKGQADGIFNTSDYLEFYGQKNDGTLDSLLYRPSSVQPHKYYNLYSDTTAYFLTYTFLQRGLRMDSVQFANTSSLAPEAYQISERLLVLHDSYNQGFSTGQENLVVATAFDQGEGWTGAPLVQSGTKDYTIDSLINGATSTGVTPKLELLLQGWIGGSRNVQISVGADALSLRPLTSADLNDFDSNLITADLNWNDIGTDGKMMVRLSVGAIPSNGHPQVSISYIKVTFPQSFDWNGIIRKKFRTEINATGQSFVTFANPTSGLRLWDVTDLQNVVRVLPSPANAYNFVLPGTGVSKSFFSSAVFTKPQISRITFRSFLPTDANFLIVTNKSLRKPTSSYNDPVKAYASYRASSQGGSYDTLTMNMDQLYNQFNYGETSPAAIYGFMQFMSQGNVKYLFLIGKGKDIWSNSAYNRKAFQPGEYFDLVPSAGYPGGDIAYTAGSDYYPSVPTGRLPAITPLDVEAYLNKVKEIESKPLQPWAKEILHLSGGGSASTSADFDYFKQIVDGFKTTAEGVYLGGHVTTEAKQILGQTKVNVAPIVNSGVNLVTFFGHSSSYSTEIDIGFVNDPTLQYSNPGKYPVFLINGCNAGTIFANMVTFGENWLQTASKGSRNFIASTSFGFANELQQYSDLFYKIGFGDSTFIKVGIGDIQKEVCRQYVQQYGVNIYSGAQTQQMVLAGDPSLKLFGTATPDYAVDNGSISLFTFDNKPVNSLTDSFGLKIIVKNLGAFKQKPLTIRLIRTFNDGSTKSYDSTYSPVLYIDTLTFRVKKEKSIDGFGNNLLTVLLDPMKTIKELNENNNTGTLSYFIPSLGTLNLFPKNFAIVNTNIPQFVFQDANLLGSQQNFLLQVDTSARFNSPYLIKQTLSAKVLAKTTVTILNQDSTVYYWRTRPVVTVGGDSSSWSTSSFVYINNGSEGWAQRKFPQLNTDVLINLEPDPKQQNLIYPSTINHLSVKAIGANSPSVYTDASMKYQDVEYNVTIEQCQNNSINVVAFNKQTAVPYLGVLGFWNDPRNCGLQPFVINSFTSTQLESLDGIDLIHCIDKIKPSDSVVLFSIGNPAFSTWSSTVLTKLNDVGISSTQITSLADGEPVVIFARKGAPIGSAKVVRTAASPSTAQDLSVSATVTGRPYLGTIQSPLIGPAKKWSSFSRKTSAIESTDHVSFSIYGVSMNNDETLLIDDIMATTDLSSVDPSKYPFIKVKASLIDSINLTAAQLRNWFVLYESVAEGVLYYSGSQDQLKLQEGQVVAKQFGFTNISNKSFSDSLLVRVDIANQSNARTQGTTFNISAPLPNDTTKFSIPINSRGKIGINDVVVFVNPKIQPEQYYENNVISLFGSLDVTGDYTLPTMDVTIDNRYLQNGDYVSSSPLVRVDLHDNNPFLFVNDTTHVNIFLSYPCASADCPFQRIAFSRNDMHWTPASANSDFVATFHPVDLPAGSYNLRITGTDASGNSSGPQPYQVNFEVGDQTTLTLKSISPNPSTGVFNFNFELAGNELPDDFSMQVFSSDGRLIHEYGLSDIESFEIGSNSLRWDATTLNTGSEILVCRLRIGANGKTLTQNTKLVLVK